MTFQDKTVISVSLETMSKSLEITKIKTDNKELVFKNKTKKIIIKRIV